MCPQLPSILVEPDLRPTAMWQRVSLSHQNERKRRQLKARREVTEARAFARNSPSFASCAFVCDQDPCPHGSPLSYRGTALLGFCKEWPLNKYMLTSHEGGL